MINRIELKNFGPINRIDWQDLGNINLVIGNNGSGKTFLLKALYSGMRTLEEYKRGNDQRAAADILADKLYWTFQPEKIGDLVTKGAETPLSCSITFDQKNFRYSFGKDTKKEISTLESYIPPRNSNSVFVPAKEVLSLYHNILDARERDQMFGFDDTYLDLARALRQSPMRGRNYKAFSDSRQSLSDILGGKVEYDEAIGWQFKKGNQKFSIGVTAEGIKKIAIFDTLLGNRYLDPGSVIFFDEPESALHPSAISRLLDIVAILGESGIQFFLASHSYFVVKKLFLVAMQKRNLSIQIMSLTNEGGQCANLKDGMPDNPIIDESIELYEKEMELVL